MDKTEFLKDLQEGRAAWDEQLSRMKPEQMSQAGVVGDWSVKDLVAHVAWSEREMVGVLETMTLAGSDLWRLSQDERNAVVYEENRRRPLKEVLTEEQSIYTRLLELLEALSEQDLNHPQGFKDMPEDWVPWQMFRGNTYKHYHEHSRDIRDWLEKNPR